MLSGLRRRWGRAAWAHLRVRAGCLREVCTPPSLPLLHLGACGLGSPQGRGWGPREVCTPPSLPLLHLGAWIRPGVSLVLTR